MNKFVYLFFFAGFVLVALGCFEIWRPLGFIVTGAILLFFAAAARSAAKE